MARREARCPRRGRKPRRSVTWHRRDPDGSIRVLLIDESAPGGHIPWSAIERKLVARNPVVVAFAWSREGYGRHAQFALPTAVYPETDQTTFRPAIDSPGRDVPPVRLA